jgi:hypothetical protein
MDGSYEVIQYDDNCPSEFCISNDVYIPNFTCSFLKSLPAECLSKCPGNNPRSVLELSSLCIGISIVTACLFYGPGSTY